MDIPDRGFYMWCFEQGLKHVPLEDILSEAARIGRQVRTKDVENYWNGWYRSALYSSGRRDIMSIAAKESRGKNYFDMRLSDYPDHPFNGQPEIEARWVPCSENNKPLLKWGNGCMRRIDAECMIKSKYLAENMKGTRMIVVDCDGDHGWEDFGLAMDTIKFLGQYRNTTHTMSKPKSIDEYGLELEDNGWPPLNRSWSASFHLTFLTDKVIPTMHFPKAHIDIIGNAANSLRYLKDKRWNGVQMAMMTDEIWEEIKEYIRSKEQ